MLTIHPHIRLGILVVTALIANPTLAIAGDHLVVDWNSASLEGARDSKLGPPIVARALAIVHTCMYDAWAAYDEKASPTEDVPALRRKLHPRRQREIEEAVSFAAYRAAIDLFPGDKASVFDPLMKELGYDASNNSLDPRTPAGVGNLACAAVLADRHNDGSNQLGDLTPSGIPYADWTGYAATNPPSAVPVSFATVGDPDRWQPLQYIDATGHFTTQTFLGAQWYRVKPFAMTSGDQFRSFVAQFGPAQFGTSDYVRQAQDLITLSANLTDEQKMIAEYWKDGPHSETPPGHWCLFAQFISARDHHTLADDVKMFFVLTNAVFDASIGAWDAKRAFDSVRPATSILFLFHGQQIRAWGGPNRGTITMDGGSWIPYQPDTFPTPPFPEYISGHSTFSAAAAEVLRLWTGSDRFGAETSFAAGSSTIEPGSVPSTSIRLHWATFTEAADQAGISRRYGGIHFERGDLVGRATGTMIGMQAWKKAQSLFGNR